MKQLILLLLLLGTMCFSFGDSGDYITIIVYISEVKPTYSINTLTFESGTRIIVEQDNISRTNDSYVINIDFYSVRGEYEIADHYLADNCSHMEEEDSLHITVSHNGCVRQPYVISSWTMQAVDDSLYGLIEFSFTAV